MFSPGDRVVCIKAMDRYPDDPEKANAVLPQVGCHYTVYDTYISGIGRHPCISLEELPCEARGKRWWFFEWYFRKIEEIAEPKRVVREAPKELELEHV